MVLLLLYKNDVSILKEKFVWWNWIYWTGQCPHYIFGRFSNNFINRVHLLVPPEFSKTPSSSISAPGIRETLRISCSAKGSPLPTVTWYKNDFNVINVMNNVTNDEFTSELVINAFQPEDQGTYSCVARNVYNVTVNTNSRVCKSKFFDFNPR